MSIMIIAFFTAVGLLIFLIAIRRFFELRWNRKEQCLHCGYSRQGLPTTTCPECGRDMDERIPLWRLRRGQWVAGSVALVSAAFTLLSGYVLALNLYQTGLDSGWITRAPRPMFHYRFEVIEGLMIESSPHSISVSPGTTLRVVPLATGFRDRDIVVWIDGMERSLSQPIHFAECGTVLIRVYPRRGQDGVTVAQTVRVVDSPRFLIDVEMAEIDIAPYAPDQVRIKGLLVLTPDGFDPYGVKSVQIGIEPAIMIGNTVTVEPDPVDWNWRIPRINFLLSRKGVQNRDVSATRIPLASGTWSAEATGRIEIEFDVVGRAGSAGVIIFLRGFGLRDGEDFEFGTDRIHIPVPANLLDRQSTQAVE